MLPKEGDIIVAKSSAYGYITKIGLIISIENSLLVVKCLKPIAEHESYKGAVYRFSWNDISPFYDICTSELANILYV